MDQFSQEHKFSKAVSECFEAIGEPQFLHGSTNHPWGGRNRVVARIQVFNKYLEPEDVLHAHWLQKQALQKAPDDWYSTEVGIVHLNKVMEERSNGTFRAEMAAIQAAGPTLIGYIEREFGPHPSTTPAGRRAAMRLVPAPAPAVRPE
jgi:hypothetical protein